MKKLLYLGVLLSVTFSVYSQSENKETFIFEDRIPEFPGGEDALVSFIEKNLKYPKKARKNNIEGVVYVNFVIDKYGNCINSKITKSPSPLLSEAALDVMKKMPKWKPGKQGGKNVDVLYDIPITFSLED